MTRDEILAMEPGRELDMLVQKYMFKSDVFKLPAGWAYKTEVSWNFIPNYSTDTSAAMEVLDMFKGFEIVKHSYEVKVKVVRTGQMGIAYADSVPLAICRAALLAVMGP